MKDSRAGGIEIRSLQQGDELWPAVAAFAAGCSWRAGPYLAGLMRDGVFTDWERVIVALEQGAIVAFSTVTRRDFVPDVDYTPYAGFVFVSEACRGRRISEQMLAFAAEYVRGIGFAQLYLVSSEQGLYERYGFRKMADVQDIWGGEQQIFVRPLNLGTDEDVQLCSAGRDAR